MDGVVGNNRVHKDQQRVRRVGVQAGFGLVDSAPQRPANEWM